MTFQDVGRRFRDLFLKFRKTVWFRVVYLVLLGWIVAFLFPLTLGSSVGCLMLFLMPLTVFVVPYWLRERRARNFALNALLVFLIAILVVAAFETQALLSQDRAEEIRSVPEFSAQTMALTNGTVTPFHVDSPQTFTFRVNLTTTQNDRPDNYSVFLNLTVIRGLTDRETPVFPMAFNSGAGSSNNTKNGTWYETQLNLTTSIYGYGFSVTDGKQNWTYAGPVLGPLLAPSTTYFGFFVYVTAFFMLLPLTFYFVILFMWWYMIRMRQSRMRMLGAKGEPEAAKEKPKLKPEAKPESGGTKVSKAAAFTCTNCGADVDESDEKCPKCGAVFED